MPGSRIGRDHEFRIEYCAPCNYVNLALALAGQLLGRWGPIVRRFELSPSAWGTFEVSLDGELIYSKWARGRHPRPGEMLELVKERLGSPLEDYLDHPPERVDADGFPIVTEWPEKMMPPEPEETAASSAGDPIAAVEGDPNGIPWRNRPGGPILEWVQARELKPGDRVMQQHKYVHVVHESALADGNHWKLTIGDPAVAGTSERDRPEKITAAMPKRRELLITPDSPYRRVVSSQ
jgi:selenoprotein W-related protein